MEGRYPFENAAASMPLSDFGDVFGHGGLFDQFFKEKLEPLVDTSRRPWTWRPESVEASTIPLSRFEEAADIRQMFFPEGGKTPKLQFAVTLWQTSTRTRPVLFSHSTTNATMSDPAREHVALRSGPNRS